MGRAHSNRARLAGDDRGRTHASTDCATPLFAREGSGMSPSVPVLTSSRVTAATSPPCDPVRSIAPAPKGLPFRAPEEHLCRTRRAPAFAPSLFGEAVHCTVASAQRCPTTRVMWLELHALVDRHIRRERPQADVLCRTHGTPTLASGRSQQVVHHLRRLPVHRGQDMTIGVEGDRYGGVAEHLRHLLRVHIAPEQ